MHMLAPAVSAVFGLAALSWFALAFFVVFSRRDTNKPVWSVLAGTGSAALLAGGLLSFSTHADLRLPLDFGSVTGALRLDPLSAWFLCVVGLIGALISPYIRGYMDHAEKSSDLRVFWAAFAGLLLSMAATILAANAQTFLVAWELMSLTSFLLVATNHQQRATRHAALVYLGATRAGTAFLAMGFLWAHALTHSWTFSEWHLSGSAALGPGLFILCGLGVKAGMWPFHVWLRLAHPAAPAPVSALMSGVMVKVAIATIVRLFLVDTAFDNVAFGFVLVSLGAVGGLWGVLFALLQNDIKRLLALCTVENVGLILIGVGVSIVARRVGLPLVSQIALAAALFHILSHALFKSLLFLGAGAVEIGAGSRDIGALGGVGKRMPWTYACFTIGAAAICGLPPLSGFAGEWLLYQSLLRIDGHGVSPLLRFGTLLLIGVVALIGALAFACFVKVVGVVFQGRPRSHRTEHAVEVGSGMRTSQCVLAFFCAALGLAMSRILPLMHSITNPMAPSAASLNGVWVLPLGLLAGMLVSSVVVGLVWISHAERRAPARTFVTWECGFGRLPIRAQVSGPSFIQPIARMFGFVFRYVETLDIGHTSKPLFPSDLRVSTSTESVLETKLYRPALRWIRHLGEKVLRLQEASIHRYLLTMAITLVVLLLIGGYTH